MKTYKKLAKTWAENNSTPGIKGRNTNYEILISIQEAAFSAGFEKAIKIMQDDMPWMSSIVNDTINEILNSLINEEE